MMTVRNLSASRLSRGLWGLWLVAAFSAFGLTSLAILDVYPPGDLTLARLVQGVRLPGLGLLSELLYHLGSSPAFPLIGLATAALMAWRRQRLLALFMMVAVLARWATSGLLKDLVERPRPSPLLVDVSEQANGFSFPSGHVLGTVLLFGFICFASQQLIVNPRTRRWVQVSCLVVIGLMGVQRVYAGAHWPTDVLAGYLWGSVILFALTKLYQFCGRCHRGPMGGEHFPGARPGTMKKP